jgi:hypothetical protein
MTGPRLLFESTRDFLQSAIRTVIPLPQKIPCESKVRRDYPAPGEKCGLAIQDWFINAQITEQENAGFNQDKLFRKA